MLFSLVSNSAEPIPTCLVLFAIARSCGAVCPTTQVVARNASVVGVLLVTVFSLLLLVRVLLSFVLLLVAYFVVVTRLLETQRKLEAEEEKAEEALQEALSRLTRVR